MYRFPIKQLLATPNHHVYALLDGAVANQCIPGLTNQILELFDKSCQINLFSLFDEQTAIERERPAVFDYSPCLFDVTQQIKNNELINEHTKHEFLTTLIDSCLEYPVLSFLVTTQTLQETAAHLMNILFVFTEDKQKFMVRFADTRMLFAFFRSLTPDQKIEFLGLIQHWYFYNDKEVLNSLNIYCPQREVLTEPSKLPIVLSDESFVRLMESVALYELIGQLQQFDDPHFNALSVLAQIKLVKSQHEVLESELKNRTREDVFNWFTCVFEGGERFYKHHTFRNILFNTRYHGESFTKQIEGITFDWETIRQETLR